MLHILNNIENIFSTHFSKRCNTIRKNFLKCFFWLSLFKIISLSSMSLVLVFKTHIEDCSYRSYS